ncbi:TPA_asm: hypothetical protein GZX72_14735 [Listeria monocytogenes]|nr:hypothetical protein [Listeria monocytogenes]
MREVIEKLLKSNISSYQIANESGINKSTIGRFRSGKLAVGSISLDNCEKLVAVARKHNIK